jgi:hypothetical protein
VNETSADDASTDDSAPITGPQVLYTNLITPTGIDVHAGRVCWVGGQTPRGLFCGPTSGGGTVSQLDSPSDLADLDDAFDIALDDANVYWSNGHNNRVMQKPLGGGAASQFFNGDNRVSYISLQGGHAYASDYQSASFKGNVVVGPNPDGVTSRLVYPLEEGAAGVAWFQSNLYWGTASPQALSFGSDQGNAVITRITVNGAVEGVAIDSAGTAYFQAGEQRIYRLRHGSTAPDVIYETNAPFGVSDVAVDDTTVYWSERDRGRIMGLAK